MGKKLPSSQSGSQPESNPPREGQIVLYQTEDGRQRIEVRLEGQTVWLTQVALADLFQTTTPNINIHLKKIYAEGELNEEATIKDYLIVRSEGRRRVERRVRHYNLEAIIAVGYRVRSHRGTASGRYTLLTFHTLLTFPTFHTRGSAAQSPGQEGKDSEWPLLFPSPPNSCYSPGFSLPSPIVPRTIAIVKRDGFGGRKVISNKAKIVCVPSIPEIPVCI
jgi:hypothetical protein